MLGLLSLTVILPLLSAGGIGLLSVLSSRLDVKKGYLRIAVAFLPAATVLVAAGIVVAAGAGARLSLSSFYPSTLAEALIELRWDSVLWPLGLALSVGTGTLLLAAGGRRQGATGLAVAVLVLLAAALAALWSGNPLTTIVCWSFHDLVLTLTWMLVGRNPREGLRVLAVGAVSGLLLWAGAVSGGGGIGSVSWGLIPVGGRKLAIWMLAGFLRIGAYPLHLWVPRDVRKVTPLNAVVLLSPLIGWGLWVRLASLGDGGLPIGSWMVVPGVLTLLIGAVLAWTAGSANESCRWIAMGVNGSVLLATVLMVVGDENAGGLVASEMTLGVVGWVLGTSMLYLGGGIDLERGLVGSGLLKTIPTVVGAMSLIGVPATAGFASVYLLMSGQVNGGWPLIVGVFLGQLFLAASIIRWLVGSTPATGGRSGSLGRIVNEAALGCLSVVIIAAGILPRPLVSGLGSVDVPSLGSMAATPGLRAWLLWAGAIIIGAGAAWADRKIRPRVSLWLDAVHDAVLLDWVYRLVSGAMEQGFALLRVIDGILGGRAALIWSAVILMILVLIGD